MTFSRLKSVGFALLILSMVFLVACHKTNTAGGSTVPPPPPPPQPQPATPAPTITLRATPASIDRGGSTTLQWEARNAATVTITPEVGDVAATGNRSVSPASSVSYQATATGPGGSATDIARVTVNIPAVSDGATAGPRTPVSSGNLDSTLSGNVKDVLFDYDKAEIRSDMVSVLTSGATWLKANQNVRFTIEGHSDERGSEEYNLGLSDRRANAVKEFLLGQGIPANRMNTVSYGEEKPMCREQTEDCYAKNRRAHFAATQ